MKGRKLNVKTHVGLVGMSASGKTTLGRRLAQKMGLPFVDVDDLIEQEAGMPVHEIFALEGEASFRKRERLALALAFSGPICVVAVGAGAVTYEDSQAFMRNISVSSPSTSGFVQFVWVDSTDVQIAKRVKGRLDRPLLAGDQTHQALVLQRIARDPMYAQLAAIKHVGGLLALHSLTQRLECEDGPAERAG